MINITAKKKWEYSSAANIYSTPAVMNDKIVFGNQNGEIVCLSLQKNEKPNGISNRGAIYSSPAFSDGAVVIGSADAIFTVYMQKTGH